MKPVVLCSPVHRDVNFNLPTEFNIATGDGRQVGYGISPFELFEVAGATDACYGVCRTGTSRLEREFIAVC